MQDRIAEIADALIENPIYFMMIDPAPFLEWASENYDNFIDGDGPDYIAMLDHFLEL